MLFLNFLQQAIKERGEIAHAYLVTGEVEMVTAEVVSILENIFPDVFKAGTDVTIVQVDSFGIAESRLARSRAQVKAFSSRAIFILAAPTFTLEAQNALLKTLEEPEPGKHFFIVTESAEAILPTLRSRLTPFSFKRPFLEKKETQEVKDFLSKIPKERLAFVEKLYAKKEKKPVTFFMTALEEVIREALLKNPTDVVLLGYLKQVVKGQSYLKSPSANVKIILETLALTVPNLF